jgi:hypothetical protein
MQGFSPAIARDPGRIVNPDQRLGTSKTLNKCLSAGLKGHRRSIILGRMIEAPSSGSQQPQVSLTVLVPVYNERYLVSRSLERLKILEQSPVISEIQVIVVEVRRVVLYRHQIGNKFLTFLCNLVVRE